ncbi:hypothetical protein FQN54_008812 [Arachnomyces sp. PD_36]|nr:hypothetical protein FQN54_008812 [Arachnomyces sp. PD_36]
MAQTTLPQIPQNVTALLSHLCSRPGVQSTLILSRKDGSIIQCTGLLASGSSPNRNNSVTSPGSTTTEIPPTSPSADTGASAALNEVTSPTTTNPTTSNPPPYKPSQAEALAAHIHAFVSSASSLSDSLCHPVTSNSKTENRHSPNNLPRGSNAMEDTGSPTYTTEEGNNEGPEREDESEVKLLRLRTKRHEIVVVPDRRFLLCVVHDIAAASMTAGGSSSGGGGASR